MDERYTEDFADTIAKVSYERFKKLPKKGKPQEGKEWTLLSSIIMSSYNNSQYRYKVVAMATGTKCLGRSFLSDKGDLVCDSHAEVLTRRAFVRYIFHQISLVFKGEKSDVFKLSANGLCALKPGIKFHFFSSHTPCGDASIFPMSPACSVDNMENNSKMITKQEPLKRSMEECDTDHVTKRVKPNDHISDPTSCENDLLPDDSSSENDARILHDNAVVLPGEKLKIKDIFRTGAKCVEKGMQDPKGAGVNYHTVSALRTKPGRGDPTSSMSCSDKMAVWNICGLQGALAAHFLYEPIYWSSIVIGKCPFSKSALQRALVDRTLEISQLPPIYSRQAPVVLQSNLLFEYSKKTVSEMGKKIVPCSSAIIWCDIPLENFDVCVNGRRQGITKTNFDKLSSWVNVCRNKLLGEFLTVASYVPPSQLSDPLRKCVETDSTYLDFKQASVQYQEAKSAIFTVFKGWIKKPEKLQEFKIVRKKS